MKPAPFDYVAVDTAEEAVATLAETGPDARLLAGGQSLIAILNSRVAEPAVLVDISRSPELAYIEQVDGMVEIGAATTQAALEHWPALATALPLLAEALPHIGHVQTRSRGTVCGSIAHADPAAELPLCLALLNGRVRLRGMRGVRVVEGRAFQTGMLTTACAADEMIESVSFPVARPGQRFAFREMAFRHGDFAIVAVAAMADADAITLAVGGATDRPAVHVFPRAQLGEALADSLNRLAWDLDCADDAHVPAEYRRHLIRALGADAVQAVMP